MGSFPSSAALRQYQSASIVGAAADATPWKLVEMLYAGAVDRLAMARGSLQRGDIAAKLQQIGATIAIVDHLRLCVDRAAGGELAARLDALYDYMVRRLLKANVDNDVVALDEVTDLLRTLKSAWDGMAGAAGA